MLLKINEIEKRRLKAVLKCTFKLNINIYKGLMVFLMYSNLFEITHTFRFRSISFPRFLFLDKN